jgi:hypothetical protein
VSIISSTDPFKFPVVNYSTGRKVASFGQLNADRENVIENEVLVIDLSQRRQENSAGELPRRR